MLELSFSVDHSECVTRAFRDLASTCGLSVSDRRGAVSEEGGVILGVISLVGSVDWSLFICLPRATAEGMAKGFSGMNIPYESDEMDDAICEILNLLAGSTKLRLASEEVSAEISLPDTLRGTAAEAMIPDGVLPLRKSFDTQHGPLWIGLLAENALRGSVLSAADENGKVAGSVGARMREAS